MTVFADAGGWLSVAMASDRHHDIGRRHFQMLIAGRARLVTTDFVLDEVITRLRYDAGHQAAAEMITLFHESMETGVLTVVRITEPLWQRAEGIFLRYRQSKLSFTDCTSFALLQVQPADEVFGYDAQFEMMGHVLMPKA